MGAPTESLEALWRTRLRRGAIGSLVDRSSSCTNARAIVVGTGKGDLHGTGNGNRKGKKYRIGKGEGKRETGKKKGRRGRIKKVAQHRKRDIRDLQTIFVSRSWIGNTGLPLSLAGKKKFRDMDRA